MPPAASGAVTQWFTTNHPALDIANRKGTPVIAPHSMKVTFVGRMGTGKTDAGLVVQLGDENNGHRLCHLNRAFVSAGQFVERGQKVGEMGNTGYVLPAPTAALPDLGTHLHWVMFINGSRVDPSRYFQEPTKEVIVVETADEAAELIRSTFKREPTQDEINSMLNRYWKDRLVYLRTSEAGQTVAAKVSLFDQVAAELASMRVKFDELAKNPTRSQFDALHADFIKT